MAVIETMSRHKKPTRYYSDKQEKGVAKTFEGKQTPNSGATMFQKSDVLLDNFTVECKTKMEHSESISIKKDWIEKQLKESCMMGKPYWTIAFNFGPNEKNYYIIDENLFKILTEKIEN